MFRYRLTVAPLSHNSILLPDNRYDLFIAALGFESRSRFIPVLLSNHAAERVAVAFGSRHVLDYEENRDSLAAAGFELSEVKDDDLAKWCAVVFRSAKDKSAARTLRIAIDISCMSRLHMASLVSAAVECATTRVHIDFLYAPAEFAPPPKDTSPIVISEPVTAAFAGWSTEPDKPPLAVFGLGYEADKALGALEYIEAVGVWAFRPEGEDSRYDDALEVANDTFWTLLPAENVIRYQIDNPHDCFVRLESLVHGAKRMGRPILIPFGPKIFSICCLLVALVHYPDTVVWRVSSGQYEAPQNRVANGKLVGLRTSMLKA